MADITLEPTTRPPRATEWQLSAELYESLDHSGKVIHYGGRSYQFRKQDTVLHRTHHADYTVTAGGRTLALIERYGDFEAGVYLPSREHRSAIIVRSLDEIIQLIPIAR